MKETECSCSDEQCRGNPDTSEDTNSDITKSCVRFSFCCHYFDFTAAEIHVGQSADTNMQTNADSSLLSRLSEQTQEKLFVHRRRVSSVQRGGVGVSEMHGREGRGTRDHRSTHRASSTLTNTRESGERHQDEVTATLT